MSQHHLARYDEACRAVAACKSVDEAKDFRDMAMAMAAYARQAKNKDLEADAIEIRMRATRRLDKLRELQKQTVGLAKNQHAGLSENPAPTLASQGIDKNLANQARRLGALPDERFETAVAEARDRVANAPGNAIKRQQREMLADELRRGNRPLPKGKYAAIYADPPWKWKPRSERGEHNTEQHYPTEELDDIKALPVGDLAADDCILFLWAIGPMLPHALQVIEAWGFTYKTIAFTWVKTTLDGSRPRHGQGYWTRANAELCLLATRGSPTRINADVPQIIEAPRREHSRKPDEAAARIERLVGGP
jgi:N6-adenosine-specific RNA methylase IME4